MSEAAKSVTEIEDVLSSIRRLVAEGQGAASAKSAAAPARDPASGSSPEAAPAVSSRLVLTAAHRVTDPDDPWTPVPPATAEAEAGDPAWGLEDRLADWGEIEGSAQEAIADAIAEQSASEVPGPEAGFADFGHPAGEDGAQDAPVFEAETGDADWPDAGATRALRALALVRGQADAEMPEAEAPAGEMMDGGMPGAAGMEDATPVVEQDAEAAVTAGDVEAARNAGDDDTARNAGDDDTARNAGDDDTARIAGDDDTARIAGEDETARNAGDSEAARIAGDSEAARNAGDSEAARNAGDDETARNAGEAKDTLILGGAEAVPAAAGDSTQAAARADAAPMAADAGTDAAAAPEITRIFSRRPEPAPQFAAEEARATDAAPEARREAGIETDGPTLEPDAGPQGAMDAQADDEIDVDVEDLGEEPTPFTFPETEEGVLDEDTLRQMIADVLREELQGVLGQRITRNVRKMVRREVRLALAAQELE
jgi:hypothetical protein